MAVVNMEMPEEMISFVVTANREEQIKRNAMILYPYVHDGVISHGRAAEIYDCGLIQKHDVKACIDTMLVSNIRLDKKICNMVMTHIGMDESY